LFLQALFAKENMSDSSLSRWRVDGHQSPDHKSGDGHDDGVSKADPQTICQQLPL
jgi:hypothetical protein